MLMEGCCWYGIRDEIGIDILCPALAVRFEFVMCTKMKTYFNILFAPSSVEKTDKKAINFKLIYVA